MTMKRILFLIAFLAMGFPSMAQGVRKTADEFNKMSRNDTSLVVLHGVVSRLKGDQRGVFYLKDETGEAYIYGLVDGRPGSNVSFPQMQIVMGDTLTIAGRHSIYNGTIIEMAGGHLLRKADGPNHAAEWERMSAVDIEPRFKNQSANAFSPWVTARLKYPKDAKEDGIEGTVVVKFVIGTNGGVQEIEVEQGVFPSLDAEAVRVVKNSPKWRPAVKDGKPVRFTYHFPVVFVLPN